MENGKVFQLQFPFDKICRYTKKYKNIFFSSLFPSLGGWVAFLVGLNVESIFGNSLKESN
jgi:hypothetical protein